MNDQIQIARIAYEKWQRRGCSEGSAEEDWLAAERQLAQALEEESSTENAVFVSTRELDDVATAK